MNINTLDLNLFLVFQAIHETRSVTLAGERLSMTQSAVSNALKRMRERFDDPLFVRTVDGMVPTPMGELLIGPVAAGLSQLTQAVEHSRHFDPAESNRLFRIAINDIGQLVIMPRLLDAARQQAPGIRFETVDAALTDARQRMLHGQIDLAIGSWEPMGPTFYQQRVFEEGFVVLMQRDHPLAQTEMTIDDYLDADHLAYSPNGATDLELQNTLQRAGVVQPRKVVLTAAHSLGLSSIVASSRLLLTAPSRLAHAMASSRHDLAVQPTPFEVTPFPIRQQWHERYHRDSGNRWLRELVFSLLHQPSTRKGVSSAPHAAVKLPVGELNLLPVH